MRHLAGEGVNEYNAVEEDNDSKVKSQMAELANMIVPSQMKHHAQAEACDLLMEVEQLGNLQKYVLIIGCVCTWCHVFHSCPSQKTLIFSGPHSTSSISSSNSPRP